MSKNVKKKPGKLPKEKKKSPLGRRPAPNLPSASNFAYDGQIKTFTITSVSKREVYSNFLSKKQNNEWGNSWMMDSLLPQNSTTNRNIKFS
ncbi:MAG TPA: hypothetical protein VI461_17845 [Chitinophagaceae bacterium]|nr:hypothetical protein [Chitinophagaceae bacterium]